MRPISLIVIVHVNETWLDHSLGGCIWRIRVDDKRAIICLLSKFWIWFSNTTKMMVVYGFLLRGLRCKDAIQYFKCSYISLSLSLSHTHTHKLSLIWKLSFLVSICGWLLEWWPKRICLPTPSNPRRITQGHFLHHLYKVCFHYIFILLDYLVEGVLHKISHFKGYIYSVPLKT